MDKIYLGGGVYVEHDAHGGLWLTTDAGYGSSHDIYLQPHVFKALHKYAIDLERRMIQQGAYGEEDTGSS